MALFKRFPLAGKILKNPQRLLAQQVSQQNSLALENSLFWEKTPVDLEANAFQQALASGEVGV